jgi:hypothetical protein
MPKRSHGRNEQPNFSINNNQAGTDQMGAYVEYPMRELRGFRGQMPGLLLEANFPSTLWSQLTESSSDGLICAGETVFCLCTGLWCIFCFHAAIVDKAMKNHFTKVCDQGNRGYYQGIPVMSTQIRFTNGKKQELVRINIGMLNSLQGGAIGTMAPNINISMMQGGQQPPMVAPQVQVMHVQHPQSAYIAQNPYNNNNNQQNQGVGFAQTPFIASATVVGTAPPGGNEPYVPPSAHGSAGATPPPPPPGYNDSSAYYPPQQGKY